MIILTIIALALAVEINLVGRLTVAEVLLIGISALALYKNRRLSSLEKSFFLMIAVWLLGAFFTDLYVGTAYDDIARGWSKIIFFGLNFYAIGYLVGRNVNKAIWFICVLAIASALRAYLGVAYEGSLDMFGNGWKFGYGQAFTICLFALSAWMSSLPGIGFFAPFVPIAAATVNLALNARSMFGKAILAALGALVISRRRRPFRPAALLGLGIAGCLFAYLTVTAYTYAASEGLLGSEARQKYLTQTQGDLGLLLGGRTESLASTQAIWDSPILGHGSWARDIKYIKILLAKLNSIGVEVMGDPLKDDLIPSHSHLFGAWVEHGMLGALFWVWAFWLTLQAVYATVQRPSPYSGLILFIAFSLLWDILFSPFALTRRVITAAWIYLMMLVIQHNFKPSQRARAPVEQA